ncbi:hypothetical protein TorRG33x02_000300 [Trema orientale]|uniref:DUF4378 domain-containing protein n=1 Tax=Trema orientale TaxID=63057 RepID=A0A2P5G118_TREOI|nr:hypothetical protein TorRG33x02_000300 [Trema orientale]
MASTITKRGKQLGELLQKEQEPFVLDVFLNERGYPKNSTRKTRTKGIPSCSRILTAIFSKFAWNKNDQSRNTKTTTTTTTTCSDDQRSFNGQQVAELDTFSSASSRTAYNSCSESDCKDESPTSLDNHDHSLNEAMKEAVSGGVFEPRKFIGSSKQYSPCSAVQEEIHLCQGRINLKTRQHLENQTKISSPILPRKVIEKPKNTSTKISDPTELVGTKSSPQLAKSRRVLHQTRQLLFDCVREIVETHAKRERGHYGKGVLGPEELGELLWEKMKAWSKLAGDDSNNITYLLGLDFVDSAQEWMNGFDSETKEICSEIGDAIAEEIMNEFVIETMS